MKMFEIGDSVKFISEGKSVCGFVTPMFPSTWFQIVDCHFISIMKTKETREHVHQNYLNHSRVVLTEKTIAYTPKWKFVNIVSESKH